MSTTVLDVVSVPHLVGHPGGSPSVTVPMVGATVPEASDLWAHLLEPAGFFGIDIGSSAALGDALTAYAAALRPAPALTALTVTAVAGESRFVVTGTPVGDVLGTPVRIARCDLESPLAVPEDPHWRRMAARTTSRADRDQLARWLGARGFVDAVPTRVAAVPLLGALVYEVGDELLGVENPEPTSVLEQLDRCGVLAGVRRVAEAPTGAGRIWWISPGFTRHPVSAIGDAR